MATFAIYHTINGVEFNINNQPDLTFEIVQGVVDQIQSDWNQTNNTAKDFIKNKPTIPTIDPNTVIDADYATDKERLKDTSGENTGNETASSIGALIETTELETITDETKIAGSVAGVVNWFSGLRIKEFLSGFFAKISDYFSKTQSDGRYVTQNGGTIYHTTKWFTPTALQTLTINANGTQATLNSGTSFTASMTGAKLRVVGSESEPIITYSSTTVINLSPALDSALFGQVVAFGNWGVYSRFMYFDENTVRIYGVTANQATSFDSNANLSANYIEHKSYKWNLNNNGANLANTSRISWTDGVSYGNVDTSIKRNSEGVIEINNGTAGQYSDLILRQLRLGALNTAPTSATDTGTLGEIRIDANYIYFCFATNQWKRTPLTTW